MKEYRIRPSKEYYNSVEGTLHSDLFGCDIRFIAKGCADVYAVRCASFFEQLDVDNPLIKTLFEAASAYIRDLLDDHEDEYDLGDDFAFEGDPLGFIKPVLLLFEREPMLTDDECPPAFTLKLQFANIADEFIEFAAHGDVPVYVGQYREVSAWNDKLLKKKWNYLGKV